MNYTLEDQKLIREAVNKVRNKVDVLINIYEIQEEYEICNILFQYREVVLARVLNEFENQI